MGGLIKCLYEFALEKRMAELEIDQEYRDSIRTVQMQEKKVREILNEDQWQEIDLLMRETSAQDSIEREYLFRAALELAGELNALSDQSQTAVAK